MTDREKDRRLRLDTELKTASAPGGRTDWWLQWAWAADSRRNWNDLVPGLQGECNGGGGEITHSFLDAIVQVSGNAISVKNPIEGTSA